MRNQKNAGFLLLVEDDPINADIASRMLQKMGLSVKVAENGIAALQSWQPDRFDLVLMDCEMVEMDGFETTRQIRKVEAATPGSRTPIVAFTAHSDVGIREKCLAAGMDDVLAKPFKDRQIAELLKRWIGAAPAHSIRATAGSIDRAAFDQISAFQGREGGRLLKVLAARFAETAPRQLQSMRDKHGEGASDEVRRIAHTLKSSAAALGATLVSQTCTEIERHAGDLTKLSAFLSVLEEELPSAVRHLMEIARDRDEQAPANG